MIAMPVEWDDLSPKFKPEVFSVRSAEKYLRQRRVDPFASLLKARQKLPAWRRPRASAASSAPR